MKLEELGFDEALWGPSVATAVAEFGDMQIGRVTADFGVEHRVVGPFGDERATLAGKLRFEHGIRPAVGDFVILIGETSSLTVVDVLPRYSWLARQAAGKKTGAQTIAANLDQVFVVTSFNDDFNFNRIERYLTAIKDGGAEGLVIVNKLDLASESEQADQLAALRARLGSVPVLATSAIADEGLHDLIKTLRPNETSSFVGSSGVGKSTLVNALLGEARQVTAEVREADAKGRHTTTHREMFFLPNGAIVIDTPGMREFQLWDEGAGREAFDDIEELAEQCRFRDCAHEREPGCAVREAVAAGELSERRLESWQKLGREADHIRTRSDEAARRERGKDFAKMVGEVQRLKRKQQDEE